jgi:hypothetical protein
MRLSLANRYVPTLMVDRLFCDIPLNFGHPVKRLSLIVKQTLTRRAIAIAVLLELVIGSEEVDIYAEDLSDGFDSLLAVLAKLN